MRFLAALVATGLLWAVAWLGAGALGWNWLFAVAIPYLALVLFVGGIVLRVIGWGRSPVPFRIPTVCGQQKSLDWIPRDPLDSPFTATETVGRMALEVLAFRSLFRGSRARLTPRKRLVIESDKWLWAGAIAFHWSLLVVLLRHLRYVTQPVPALVGWLEAIDGFFQVASPTLFVTDVVIAGALLYLLGRRVVDPRLRYISLPTDWFALLLLLSIVGSGISLRYFTKTDLVAVKQLALGLATFHPVVPDGIGTMFFVHLFLVSTLLAWFPFSKLVHMAGIFLSPTRNLANNNRARRHVNPWNPDVEVHTYEQWEDEFRDKLIAAGIDVEREG